MRQATRVAQHAGVHASRLAALAEQHARQGWRGARGCPLRTAAQRGVHADNGNVAKSATTTRCGKKSGGGASLPPSKPKQGSVMVATALRPRQRRWRPPVLSDGGGSLPSNPTAASSTPLNTTMTATSPPKPPALTEIPRKLTKARKIPRNRKWS